MGTSRLEAFSDGVLASAVGSELKEKISPVLYIIAIPSAFFYQWISGAIYMLFMLIWFI